MKNTLKGLAVIAAITLTFALASCDNGSTDSGNPPAHNHQWGDWTQTKAPTCIATGEQKRTCTLDATHIETKEIAIDPNAHDFGDTAEVTTEPTCEDDGEEEGTCELCGEKTTNTLPALDHDYANWTETTAPTCAAAGVETGTCTRNASHTTTREGSPIDPDAHDWGDWDETTPATYTTEGVETRTCSRNAAHFETRSLSIIPFTAVADLQTWYASQETNTAETAYTINLNIADITGIRAALGNNTGTKYVILDLSDSPITTIPANTFYGSAAPRGTAALVGVILPDSVESIGNYAFASCANLADVTIPNSVTSIGDGAFRDCTSLTSITIPDSVATIGSSAFQSCTGLTGITIPDSVATIGNIAFSGCTGLTGITIPDSVTSIGTFVFSGCTSLASVTFERNDTTTISNVNAFLGDLVTVSGGIGAQNRYGTYTTTAPVSNSSTWTKQ